MLCTASKTYALRSVVLSNSVLVVTPPPAEGSREDVVIRDTIHEVLELVPTLPRLQKLSGMLRGREYDEGHDEDEDMDEENAPRSVGTFGLFRFVILIAIEEQKKTSHI